jgi:basic membrane protein A
VAIGVDVDQFVSTPETAKCTAVSAEKKLKKNVSDAIVRIKDGKAVGGALKLDLTTDDVGLSPFHDFESKITADTKSKIEKAIADMKAGTLQACPADNFGNCPVPK